MRHDVRATRGLRLARSPGLWRQAAADRRCQRPPADPRRRAAGNRVCRSGEGGGFDSRTGCQLLVMCPVCWVQIQNLPLSVCLSYSMHARRHKYQLDSPITPGGVRFADQPCVPPIATPGWLVPSLLGRLRAWLATPRGGAR